MQERLGQRPGHKTVTWFVPGESRSFRHCEMNVRSWENQTFPFVAAMGGR
jgi:hypothetical protein